MLTGIGSLTLNDAGFSLLKVASIGLKVDVGKAIRLYFCTALMNVFDGAVELLLAILHLLVDIIGGFSSLIGPLGMGSVANIRRRVVLYFRTLDLNVFGLCQSCLDSLDALVVGTLDLNSILLRNSF